MNIIRSFTMKKNIRMFLVVCTVVCLTITCKKKEEEPKPSPEVKTVTPVIGMPGNKVTLKGAALGGNPEATKITFNDIEASIVSINDDSIVVKIPDNAIKGQNQLTVKINGEVIQGVTVPFTITFPPKIASLSITKGRIGAYVTLTVDDLNTTDLNALTVKFGDVEAPKASLDGNKVNVVAPAPTVAASTVKVGLSIGNSKSINELDFKYEASPTVPEEVVGVPQSGIPGKAGKCFFSAFGTLFVVGTSNSSGSSYESSSLKPNGSGWEKINLTYSTCNTGMLVGDNLFLGSNKRIIRINAKTGEWSFLAANNDKITNNRFFGIAADAQGNLYLPGTDTQEVLKVSTSNQDVEALPGFSFSLANRPMGTAVVGNYLFIAADDNKLYKYDLSTKTLVSFLYQAKFDIRSLNVYKNKLYLFVRERGIYCVDPQTGAETKILSTSYTCNSSMYIDESTGIIYYINDIDGKAYRYYLN